MRYRDKSKTQDYYQQNKGVEVTAVKAVSHHLRAKNASDTYRVKTPHNREYHSHGGGEKYAGIYNERKIAVKYLYSSVFGAPPKEQWHRMKLVPVISHMLNIPKSSHSRVNEVLGNICDLKVEYHGKRLEGSGKVAAIQHGTAQADIIYRALQQGLTAKESVCILNMYREKLPVPGVPLCRSAVEGFISRSDCIKVRKRQLQKSGKDDPGCGWAMARTAQAEQFREQLLIGFLPENSPERIESPFPPIYTDGIVFWDEHHREVILGEANAYQYLISRNESGVVTLPADGGTFGKNMDITSIKYPGEGRGCFGVAIVSKFDEKEGVRLKPFNYTGRKVITEKALQVAIEIEIKRVKPLKGIWKRQDYGYEERYGDTWATEVRKEVSRTLCSINDIIDHVITESTNAYIGTSRANNFFIFHDGLTCWWTSESQDYIASKGFRDRQLCCMKDTNRGTKVVGDSPEICRGLDAYGFSDFKRSTERMRALTSVYDIKDPRRFNFGTPSQVWYTMERCWTMEPTSDRIIADIEDFGNILELIIEFKGVWCQSADYDTVIGSKHTMVAES